MRELLEQIEVSEIRGWQMKLSALREPRIKKREQKIIEFGKLLLQECKTFLCSFYDRMEDMFGMLSNNPFIRDEFQIEFEKFKG